MKHADVVAKCMTVGYKVARRVHSAPVTHVPALEEVKMKLRNLVSVVALALVPLLSGSTGCSSGDDSAAQSGDVTELSNYTLDFARMNETYPGQVPMEKLEDPWTALVKVGEQVLPAPTHLFGDVVNIIPYSNEDDVTDAAGEAFPRGDMVVAKYVKPGDVAIGLKMHRPEQRFVDLNDADPNNMKEHFKLLDTHIELVVGVDRAEHGQAGAITLNNPQSYESGRFGNKTYSMIFLTPVLPDYALGRAGDYMNNIRAALVGFNATSDFPGNYNGGDPLGAYNPERLQEYVDQMVRGIAGDQAALDWFEQDENLIYCAELAFISFSAGSIVPLTRSFMAPRVGEQVWDGFLSQVELHNKGVDELAAGGSVSEPSAFVSLNDNKRVAMVRIVLPPEDLPPMAELAPNPAQAKTQMALTAMTMSDIVEQFMRTHIPREKLGEALAPVQGAVLAKMQPGLLETMGMDQLPDSDPNKQAVLALFEQLVQVVSTPFGSYDEFRAAIEPLLAQARKVTGPRGEDGNGLFVPPSVFHVAAQGKHHGLLGFEYIGHGVHVSNVVQKAGPAPEPTPVDDIASEVSCKSPDETTSSADSCGRQAPGGCWCDSACSGYGDCCEDYAPVCGG